MNEKMPMGPSPEELEEQEMNDRYEQWMADHPAPEVVESDKVECGPHIAEYEGMIASFEAKHSLGELYAIDELSLEDSPNHPLREPARVDLIPICDKKNFLEKKTDITPEKFSEIKAEWKRVSNAVGVISRGRVQHDR